MPSDTEIVPNSSGYPLAAWTPSFAAFARRSSDRLHGVISFHDDPTPICGLAQSSSPMPTARSMPRAAARSTPSVTARECGLMSGVFPEESALTLIAHTLDPALGVRNASPSSGPVTSCRDSAVEVDHDRSGSLLRRREVEGDTVTSTELAS